VAGHRGRIEFATRSAPGHRITFLVKSGRAVRMKVEPSPLGAPLSGARVGPGDPPTFHKQPR
jgi:hypothetical protein